MIVLREGMRPLLPVLFSIFLLQGCASGTSEAGSPAAAAAAGAPIEAAAESDDEDPGWVERGDGLYSCNGMGLVRAVGKARIPNDSLARNAAAKSAKKNLEKVVGRWISDMIRAYHKKKGTDLGVIEMTVGQMTRAAMQDAKIVKSHRDGNVTSVLAQLKVDDAVNEWSQMNWGDKGEDPFVIADVPQTFAESKDVENVCR